MFELIKVESYVSLKNDSNPYSFVGLVVVIFKSIPLSGVTSSERDQLHPPIACISVLGDKNTMIWTFLLSYDQEVNVVLGLGLELGSWRINMCACSTKKVILVSLFH